MKMKNLNNFMNKDKNFSRLVLILVFIFLLYTFVFFKDFWRVDNFISMASQFPEFGLLAIAISLTMISGGIDLSVVSIANLAAIVSGIFLINFVPKGASTGFTVSSILIAILMAILIGCILGIINGFLIAVFGIPAILVTIGTLQLYTGIAVVITKGSALMNLPRLYSDLGNTKIFGFIPVYFIIFIIIATIVGIILSKTRLGMHIYLFGTNEKASHFAGLNNTWIIIRVYMISGMIAAVSGLIMMSRASSAQASTGASYILPCVLIAVMGGVNPKGGFGNILGVVTAIIIMQVLSNGISLINQINPTYRDLIWGFVLILILLLDYIMNKRQEKISLKGK
jgi:Ribose/xylose/arabinose/galactoside ABC-type transport systems, permease components